ncbi:MAG: hypothetical protein BMS9Abin26_0397 [Gammaproteobacteria bacterium]|nr:MAG: hypothetical protein BMS9Abin26_0397 [Gammaproteobacteria bacterium]
MPEIGKIGVIKSGANKDWQLQIIDDNDNTGGYLILISKDFSNPKVEGFDDWVDSEDSLNKYFIESNWLIEWS